MSEEKEPAGRPGRDPAVVRGRLYRITIYLLIVLSLVLLIWKIVNEAVMEDRHEEAMNAQRAEAAALLSNRTADLVRTAGIAAGMAVREALMENDVTRLRRYADLLVRETVVETMTVAGADGAVLASSDRNREGTRLDATVLSLFGTLDGAVTDSVGEHRMRVVLPVTGVNQRIGVLVVVYRFAETEESPQ